MNHPNRGIYVHRNTEVSTDSYRYKYGHRRDIIIGGPRGAYSYFVRHADGSTRIAYGSRPSTGMVILAQSIVT